MDAQTVSYVNELLKIINGADETRLVIERFLTALRHELVFDNVAAYLQDNESGALEIVYARAVGRAKTAEADAAWGEEIASQVLANKQLLLQEPTSLSASDDRVHQPFLLGLPLHTEGVVNGALVFVRFGGPAYAPGHISLAALGASLLSLLFERRTWRKMNEEMGKLKQQIQLQEDFVSTISHELRTPLGFIKGYSTSLLRDDTSWDAETQKEFLTIIDEEADRLSLLIENVLESARLQSKTLPLRFQPLRLDAVLRDVSTRVRSRYKDLDVTLDLRSSTTIQADGVRIAQVFENLFNNAIKYAPGSPIIVGLKQVGHLMVVTFTDYGPGIPPESLPLIFERFYRLRTENATGTGLGLYICKQIIEAHRGKIWAESKPGQGTTFFIELPVNQTAIT
ncbi:MAG: sensor histidine kinase [Chloroflexota bacterium]|nr:HAMP domain-containing histidine kinase [Chloroflexota bacterium]MBI5705210.1 HAMP domain-containing histidine kinase [Chloroflexota bacterium]